MNTHCMKKEQKRWLLVLSYAIAMAWVEAAVVFYLRTLGQHLAPELHDTAALPPVPGLDSIEMVREAATLIMLWTVGMLAGDTWRSRWGYAAVAFGAWDICYYLFLMVTCGWPNTPLDWDLLFLLPLPWWGPVLSPMLIAVLMIAWGSLASQGEPFERPFRSEWRAWVICSLGMGVALYVFMEDALRAVRNGLDPFAIKAPTRFDWPVFVIGLGLMAAPVLHTAMQIRAARARRMPGGLQVDTTA